MKKRRRSKVIKREFPLPEAMIQHIQSFLRVKEAAQTSLVSKSWHSAWSTRPNLNFDTRDFDLNVDEFWELMEKTMQRYVELNHKIESFVLYLDSIRVSEQKPVKMVEELIVKAMKIGSVHLDFVNKWVQFTLPREVLGSKTLIRLSLFGCKIDLGEERNVSCSGLKFLSLTNVEMGSDTLCDIVSSCPVIENFTINSAGPSLGSVVSGPVNLYQLHKLKSLILYRVDLDSSFFSDLSSKFPFLKDLCLNYCGGYEEIELSSRSLECITFVHFYYHSHDHLLWAKYDVPNIRKFKLRYTGLKLPSLSFKTASMEWESDISITCLRGSAKWFLKLNKMLDCLSSSRISLSLYFSSFVERYVDFQGLRKSAVENLDINMMPNNHLLIIKSLFQSCRPEFITQRWWPSCGGNVFLKTLHKTLVLSARGRRGSGSNLFVVQDLEEVNVELYEESVAEWRPLSWSTLLRENRRKKVRLQLRWQPGL